MGTRKPGRVRPLEGFASDLGQTLAGQRCTSSLAQEDRCDIAEHFQAVFEGFRLLADDHDRVGGQRVGVDRRDED